MEHKRALTLKFEAPSTPIDGLGGKRVNFKRKPEAIKHSER